MNAHDKGNLDFVLSLDDTGFEEWAESASDDDILYALELITTRKAELEVERMEVEELSVTDFTEANTVLAKFLK